MSLVQRTRILNSPFSLPVRKNNGSKPSHWRRGSGSVARKALQTLEQLKWLEKDAAGGRRLSSQGRRDLDRIAAQIKKATPAVTLAEGIVIQ